MEIRQIKQLPERPHLSPLLLNFHVRTLEVRWFGLKCLQHVVDTQTDTPLIFEIRAGWCSLFVSFLLLKLLLPLGAEEAKLFVKEKRNLLLVGREKD